MLLMSRHLTEYYIVPAGAVIRINLAWEYSLNQLRNHLEELTHHVFLDVPAGRIKPPCHQYSISDIIPFVNDYESIRYIGISNTEDPEDLMAWQRHMPKRVHIVPKIETIIGCKNIEAILKPLRQPRTIMLDHDDLFHDLLKQKRDPRGLYPEYINPLVNYCKRNDIRLLRTAGVIFSTK